MDQLLTPALSPFVRPACKTEDAFYATYGQSRFADTIAWLIAIGGRVLSLRLPSLPAARRLAWH